MTKASIKHYCLKVSGLYDGNQNGSGKCRNNVKSVQQLGFLYQLLLSVPQQLNGSIQ